MKHPTQPLYIDEHKVIRFKPNKIVEFLRKTSSYSLNHLASLDFSQEDWEQFAQLTGYSLSGFAELHYVSDETYNKTLEQSIELRKLL